MQNEQENEKVNAPDNTEGFHVDKNSIYQTIINNKKNIKYFLFILGFAFRIVSLSTVPSGTQQDEAYQGYQSWSIVNYGIDSAGHKNAVYLPNWGCGDNALPTFFSTITVKYLGPTIFAVRLPYAVFSCLFLVLFYFFCKKLFGENFALLGLFAAAINPYFIMWARLAALHTFVMFFLLAGTYCFILALENKKYFYLSAICYGLVLYCYVLLWIAIPIILLCIVAYCFYCKKITITKELVVSGIILFVMALPLMLLLMVNYDVIPEIITNWISIPKYPNFRASSPIRGVALFMSGAITNFYEFCKILFFQTDAHVGPVDDFIPEFGEYYTFSLPLILLGLIIIVKTGIEKFKNRELFLPLMAIAPIPVGIIVFIITFPEMHRMSMVYPALIFCLAYGLKTVYEKIGKYFLGVVMIMYAVSFVFFINTYFNRGPVTFYGYERAVERAVSSDAGSVYIYNIVYPNFLFAAKMPPEEYIRDAKFLPNPGRFNLTESIGRYKWIVGSLNIDKNAVYIYPVASQEITNHLAGAGFTLEQMDNYVYGYTRIESETQAEEF